MNQEQQNKLSASLFRQLFMMKMLDYEYHFFIKFPMPSGIKNALYRGKNAFANTIADLRSSLPLSKEMVEREMKMSDEKIMAMVNILEKLAVLSEAEVQNIETAFEEMVKVNYTEEEKPTTT